MSRSAARMTWSLLLALGILALIPASGAEARPPAPTIVQPPDRFFQEGNVLDVVVSLGGSSTASIRRGARTEIQLIVDGEVIEERNLASDVGVSTFEVPVNPEDPIGLIQVCARQAGSRSDDRECRRVRAAGAREFDRLRRSLEEMNEISDAVVRYSELRLGYGHVPQTLEGLVPVFLDRVPSASPLSTPYEYTAAEGHFTLCLALPGSGEIRNDDGAFTKLPRGAITDREAARLTRQQLSELGVALESYRVDNNRYPQRIEDVAPVYQRFLHPVDPYGHRFVFSSGPDEYVLTSLGRDGLPGGEGFDADSEVTRGAQLGETTPYRGRYEYLRRTFQDLSQIAAALSYFQEQTGRWPDSLSELVGGPWFSWPRPFIDFCGNPYDYHVFDIGLGRREYRLRAFGCDGIPETDPLENVLYFSADDAGHVTAPGWRFAYLWPGLFD
ncbi:MAG: type II secretion system protein GspG [Acidobacteriia bacterium]|nr:type II secretion system protein GspG [Terriglobia bacterium]